MQKQLPKLLFFLIIKNARSSQGTTIRTKKICRIDSKTKLIWNPEGITLNLIRYSRPINCHENVAKSPMLTNFVADIKVQLYYYSFTCNCQCIWSFLSFDVIASCSNNNSRLFTFISIYLHTFQIISVHKFVCI